MKLAASQKKSAKMVVVQVQVPVQVQAPGIAWTVASVLQRGRPRRTRAAAAHLNRTAARTAMMTKSDHGASVPLIPTPGDIVQAVLEVHLARRA